jgi:phosphate-selective porin OprO/OprP
MRILLLLLLAASTATAQEEPDPLRKELDELRARQRELERRLSEHEQHAEPPQFHFGRGGFVFASADGKNELKLRAVLNVDGRAYFSDALHDTFVIRRARPFIDGTLFDFLDFRLMPDFAYGQAAILDAYVDLRPFRWLRLRAGRFMLPVGLEWMQKDTTIHLLERSYATDLVPYRSLGLMLWGDAGDGTFLYQVALVNGAPDSGNGADFDGQSGKEYLGRVFIRPLRKIRRASFTDLGFGVGGSFGQFTNMPVSTYKTVGQQTMFSYYAAAPPSATMPADPTAVATTSDGNRWRVTPQLYWYIGPVGLLAEYNLSSQRMKRNDVTADLLHRAWNVTLSFVMTMEHASFDGVVPRHPVDFRHASFGAVELVLRYSEIRFDPQTFPNFADPSVAVRRARELAVGLSWHLTELYKFMISYHRSDFAGGAPMDQNRPSENALMARIQLAL